MRARSVLRSVLVALALMAAASPPDPAEAQAKDTLVVGLTSHAPTLDPHMHFERVGILVNINMFDSLLHKNAGSSMNPRWRPPGGPSATRVGVQAP